MVHTDDGARERRAVARERHGGCSREWRRRDRRRALGRRADARPRPRRHRRRPGPTSAAAPAHRHRAAAVCGCTRASARRRCTCTAPRRRSSSCSPARGCCGRTAAPRGRPGRLHRPPAQRASATPCVRATDGLDVLAFGTRVPIELCYLPRAEHSWAGPTVLPSPGRIDLFPLDDAAEPLEFPAPGERPAERRRAGGRCTTAAPRDGRVRRDLGNAAGSQRTGLQHVAVEPGRLAAPPHCHSAEEELFVVLEGEGHLLLGDEAQPVRAAASWRAGRARASRTPSGPARRHRLLAYGTRRPQDICYYPRSNKIFWPRRRRRRPHRARRLLGRRRALEASGVPGGQDPLAHLPRILTPWHRTTST